jgi:hypothetical protein
MPNFFSPPGPSGNTDPTASICNLKMLRLLARPPAPPPPARHSGDLRLLSTPLRLFCPSADTKLLVPPGPSGNTEPTASICPRPRDVQALKHDNACYQVPADIAGDEFTDNNTLV